MLSIITGELSSVSFAGFDNRALYSADAGVQFAQQQIDNYGEQCHAAAELDVDSDSSGRSVRQDRDVHGCDGSDPVLA